MLAFQPHRYTRLASLFELEDVNAIRRLQWAYGYYIDYNRLTGDRYYRLIARNEDGRPEYSKIITLRKTGDSHFTVINPVRQHLLQLQLPRPATLKLVGLDGRTVLTLHLDAGSVNTALPENIRGIYQLTDGKESVKLLIE